ncbi:hypothetical protein VNO80_09427 [Phaseolus coccineus]|uniref:Uncharacterized protein n=1 Tax=Phaseolus coccineus TaxID=3886 RepID=A0AAN9R9I6_PHACN
MGNNLCGFQVFCGLGHRMWYLSWDLCCFLLSFLGSEMQRFSGYFSRKQFCGFQLIVRSSQTVFTFLHNTAKFRSCIGTVPMVYDPT